MAEEERIKRMTEFRTLLVSRVERVEAELESMRALLELVDTTLSEGFRRAEMVRPIPPSPEVVQPLPPTPPEAIPPPVMNYEGAVPLKTITGELLANLYVREDSMRVALAQDKNFNINTPPFMAFFVDRVLTKMGERDREAARMGEITPDRVLSYHIARDGDIIREIFIQNVTPDRSRELKSAIRWTLERMWERMSIKTS